MDVRVGSLVLELLLAEHEETLLDDVPVKSVDHVGVGALRQRVRQHLMRLNRHRLDQEEGGAVMLVVHVRGQREGTYLT